jgi:hypothetical protein
MHCLPIYPLHSHSNFESPSLVDLPIAEANLEAADAARPSRVGAHRVHSHQPWRGDGHNVRPDPRNSACRLARAPAGATRPRAVTPTWTLHSACAGWSRVPRPRAFRPLRASTVRPKRSTSCVMYITGSSFNREAARGFESARQTKPDVSS